MRQSLKEFSRNLIINHDAPVPELTLGDLRPGEIFTYINSASPDNVYIKTDGGEGSATYLPTGTSYNGLTATNKVRRVNRITIERQ